MWSNCFFIFPFLVAIILNYRSLLKWVELLHSGVIVSFQLDISGVPGKPQITNTGKEIESSFTLRWSPPSYDGGDNNIMYQVEWGKRPITDKTDNSVEENISDTSHQIENLEHGVEYEFRVKATNQAGAGEPDIRFFLVKQSTGTTLHI